MTGDASQIRPRRSLLFMPGANARAMEKAKQLDCDTILFDLEDAVAPDAKAAARDAVAAVVEAGGYGYRELVVRCNALETPWGSADIAAFAQAPISALLFPKVESLTQVDALVAALDANGCARPIWVMIESPTAILDLTTFAGHPRIEALVIGTSDLVTEMHGRHTLHRHNLDYALQRCVLVARHFGKPIFDGVHLDFRNLESLKLICESGRDMGFDGKTLIHPSHLEITNAAFGYSAAEVEHARQVLTVWRAALQAGKGVAVLDGKLVENMHAAEAERVVAYAEAIARR